MKYIIRCPYCNSTYTVEATQDEYFTCDSCGAQNTLVDVIEKIDDAAKVRAQLKEAQDAIKKEKEYKEAEENAEIIGFVLKIGIALLIMLLSPVIGKQIESRQSSKPSFSERCDARYQESEEAAEVTALFEQFIAGVASRDVAATRECMLIEQSTWILDSDMEQILTDIAGEQTDGLITEEFEYVEGRIVDIYYEEGRKDPYRTLIGSTSLDDYLVYHAVLSNGVEGDVRFDRTVSGVFKISLESELFGLYENIEIIAPY